MELKFLVCANQGTENYVQAILQAGATPVVQYLPKPCTDYDGLLLCGGNDIHPNYYEAKVDGAVDFDLPRDLAEFTLTKAFL